MIFGAITKMCNEFRLGHQSKIFQSTNRQTAFIILVRILIHFNRIQCVNFKLMRKRFIDENT